MRTAMFFAAPVLLFVFAVAGCAATPPDFESGDPPVCPVMGDPASPVFHAEFEDREYYFCCAGCRDEFVERPGLFLDRKETVSHAK